MTIIRLTALSEFRSDLLVATPGAAALKTHHLLKLDQMIRSATRAQPSITESEMVNHLCASGFLSVDEDSIDEEQGVFVHGRAWDEHLCCGLNTFWVQFPADAPFELAGKLLLASTLPDLYALFSEKADGVREVALVNEDHELIYSNDTAFANENGEDRIPIGPIILLRDQFEGLTDFEGAKAVLERSGFMVCESSDLVVLA